MDPTASAQRLLVLGAGNFGTCLAHHLAGLGHKVTLWGRSATVAAAINREQRNPSYLQEILLHPQLRASHDLAAIDLAQYDGLVLAVPTQHLRSVLALIAGSLTPAHLLVGAAKGIEVRSELLPTAIVADICGAAIAAGMATLSGPSFAIEVAQGQPTGVSIAAHVPERAKWAQRIFHSPTFRAYTSNDPIGLEVAGAVKNVIAIAAGAAAGLGLQANSRATLITRGLAEMTRIGLALGAQARTFHGLGGVGDLFLTCSSEQSRNFSVGRSLATGASLAAAEAAAGSLAEGVATAAATRKLARRLGVIAPITDSVASVLYDNVPVQAALQALLQRDAKPEFDDRL